MKLEEARAEASHKLSSVEEWAKQRPVCNPRLANSNIFLEMNERILKKLYQVDTCDKQNQESIQN